MLSIETVSVVEYPLPEANNVAAVQERLFRIHRDGVPGFVIRSSGLLETGPLSHDQITDMLCDTLRKAPHLFGRPLSTQYVLLPEECLFGPGDLHHDMFENAVPELRVQRTVSGSGKVWLGNHGKVPWATLLGQVDSSYPFEIEAKADDLLLENLVNPDIVGPDMYTTQLQAGDTVVFPSNLVQSQTHDKAGPIWHRFDTSSEIREAAAVAIQFE